jgi:O-succinylbenzoic acid--CoA ligase
LVPAQLSGLINDPACSDVLKKLKAIVIGGSSIPKPLLEKAMAMKLPVYTTYGSTEMASQITTTKPEDLKMNKNTCGRILDYRQLKIAPDSEILVKGKTLFRGYVNGDSLEIALDQEGYFHTNDTGRIDNGNLFVIGRKDLMFISGGENIFPEEIERAIESIENIDCAIVVPVQDQILGQRPVVFVKTRLAKPLDTDCIESMLRKNLEGFKIPVSFFPWPKLPNLSIKPNRKAFADYAAQLTDRNKAKDD